MADMSPEFYADQLLADADLMATVAENHPLTTPVPACPGWDLAALVRHTGGVHRWATAAIETQAQPTRASETNDPPPDGAGLAEWFLAGAARVAATLTSAKLGTPTWHPFPGPQVFDIWPRRQAHETAMHRWDAESAAGTATPFQSSFASDGVDEYFEVMLPRMLVRTGLRLPENGSLHVHCTDADGEWLIWNDHGKVGIRREHQKGTGALRGPAEQLLLTLWGRRPWTKDAALTTAGDEAVVRAWLGLSGS